jgi:hypothetical protein
MEMMLVQAQVLGLALAQVFAGGLALVLLGVVEGLHRQALAWQEPGVG